MANRPLDDLFRIRPVPRKNRHGKAEGACPGKRALQALHICEEGRMCVYVVGPASGAYSKIGVSVQPYQRMTEYRSPCGSEIMMCYFAEVDRATAFAVERLSLETLRAAGFGASGEWVTSPRYMLTAIIRKGLRTLGAVPYLEIGDTGLNADDEANARSKLWNPKLASIDLGVGPGRLYKGR